MYNILIFSFTFGAFCISFKEFFSTQGPMLSCASS